MALPPLNFPNAPTIGQTYPSPPVTGQPTYIWDGADWLSYFALGKAYVPLDGSQPMTGLLTLSGDPVAALDAVTKQYADANLGAVRYDAAQTLTTPQKTQAQTNIYTPPTIQKLLTGSGIYPTPTGCTWIRVRMVGAGSGGGGSGATGTVSFAGGNTTFGLHTANGGAAVAAGSLAGAAGGSFTIGAGAVGFGFVGQGGGSGNAVSSVNPILGGGIGGGSMMGGGAQGSSYNGVGIAAAVNSGGGGSGGGSNGVAGNQSGAGGAGGGGVDIIITAPAATYAYSIGAGGSGGAAGTSGLAGAGGNSGIIVVEEHYGS